MVTRLLNLAEVPKPPDAADALALAICHLSAGRFRAAAGAAGADRPGTESSGPLPGLARAIAAATAPTTPRATRAGRARPRKESP
jgi:crossover junction endodeoxyribonuclease RuvC